jgi:hypothetical protein
MNRLDRLWATEKLEIAPESDVGAARAALLKHLEIEGFLPAENRVAAWNQRAEDTLPLSRDGRNEHRIQDSGELNEFVAKYWAFTVAERHARWEKLRERFPQGRIAVRLKSLEAGLSISDSPLYDDSKVRELADLMRELYLLPARQRAIRRQEWLMTLKDRTEGVTMLRSLNEVEPRLLEMDRKLVWWIEDKLEPVAESFEPHVAVATTLESPTFNINLEGSTYWSRFESSAYRLDPDSIKPFDEYESHQESRDKARKVVRMLIIAGIIFGFISAIVPKSEYDRSKERNRYDRDYRSPFPAEPVPRYKYNPKTPEYEYTPKPNEYAPLTQEEIRKMLHQMNDPFAPPYPLTIKPTRP